MSWRNDLNGHLWKMLCCCPSHYLVSWVVYALGNDAGNLYVCILVSFSNPHYYDHELHVLLPWPPAELPFHQPHAWLPRTPSLEIPLRCMSTEGGLLGARPVTELLSERSWTSRSGALARPADSLQSSIHCTTRPWNRRAVLHQGLRRRAWSICDDIWYRSTI